MNVLNFLLLYMETLIDQYLQRNSSFTALLSSRLFSTSQPIELFSYKHKESSLLQSESQSLPTPSPIRIPTPQPSNTFTPILASKVPSKPPLTKTSKPSFTWKPSKYPTSVPTVRPTPVPSPRPSGKPSSIPTSTPTSEPSSRPSSRPSSIPSSKPTTKPTPIPTKKPTPRPTKQPVTRRPTRNPTIAPSLPPSDMPSTINPSHLPSSPTFSPSATGRASVAPTISTLSFPPSLSTSPIQSIMSTAPLNPSNPSYSPSLAPSKTAAPSFTQSASPTVSSTSSPSFDANENILFSATNIVTGVNLTAFRLSSTAQALFGWCIASRMGNVAATAVVISSIKESATNSTHLRSLSAVAALSVGLTDKIAVTYDVTIAAVSLPSANLTASYGILTRQLSDQVRNGNFTKTLRRLSQQRNVLELASANSSSISIRGYQIVYSSSASPTQSPLLQPKSSDASFYTSWPLYGQILLPVAFFLVAALLAAIAAISVWRFVIQSKDTTGKQQQQLRTDDANAMSLSNIYKTDDRASEDKKPNIWSFISIGRPKPYDASKEPGEHKAKEKIGVRSELALVPTVDGDGPSELFSSPLRRGSSPTRANASANLTAAALRTPTPVKQSQDGKKSSAGRSRTTATRENSPLRGSGILRTDSKRRAKGDFTRGDFQ